MSELQKYRRVYDRSLHQYVIVGADLELSTLDEFYDPSEVDARLAQLQQQIDSLQSGSAKLMAANAEYAKRHLLLLRAVEWLMPAVKFAELPTQGIGVFRYDEKLGMTWCQAIPDDLAEIIVATAPAREENGNG